MKRILLLALLTATAFAQSKPPTWHQKSPSAAHVTRRLGAKLGAALNCPLPGGTQHGIETCWSTPQAGTTTIFIAPGVCPATGIPAGGIQQSSSTALTGSFFYPSVTVGATYCVYATVSGVTAPSNTVQVTVPGAPCVIGAAAQ